MIKRYLSMEKGIKVVVLVVIFGLAGCADRADPTLTSIPVYRMPSSILVETPPETVGKGETSLRMGDTTPSDAYSIPKSIDKSN